MAASVLPSEHEIILLNKWCSHWVVGSGASSGSCKTVSEKQFSFNFLLNSLCQIISLSCDKPSPECELSKTQQDWAWALKSDFISRLVLHSHERLGRKVKILLSAVCNKIRYQ